MLKLPSNAFEARKTGDSQVEICEAEQMSVPNAPHERSILEELVIHDSTFPVVPALQIQAALDVLATGEVVPAGHVKHVDDPEVSL